MLSPGHHRTVRSYPGGHPSGRCLLGCTLLLAGLASLGCHPLSPRRIDNSKQNVAPEIRAANALPLERGEPRPVLDAVGWVFGIPGKLLLWNRKVDNHHISSETEATLVEYLQTNQLDYVKVRINQYRPWDDMRRLTKNRSVAWPWRYTLGTLSVLGETIVPGRVFGGDHFNPYTNTIHLYSDLPVIALHEAAHAKDFSRRQYPGTYAALYAIPIVPLYHESVASSDVMEYVASMGDPELQRQAHHVLYPAYGTYVGGAAGSLFPPASLPIYYASVAGGHLAGRLESRRISATPTNRTHNEFESTVPTVTWTVPTVTSTVPTVTWTGDTRTSPTDVAVDSLEALASPSAVQSPADGTNATSALIPQSNR